MGQHTTTSERMDELPLLVYWLKQMQVDVIIDRVLGAPHGNWEGLSYGELALVFQTSDQPEPGPGQTGPGPGLHG